MLTHYAQSARSSTKEATTFHIKDAFLKKVRDALEPQLANPNFGVAELCQKLGTSQPQLYRKVKSKTKQSIAAYIRSIRLQKGFYLLKTNNMNVTEVAYNVGFADPFYFSRAFAEEFGFPPSKVKNR